MSHSDTVSARQLWAAVLGASSAVVFGPCVRLGWPWLAAGGAAAAGMTTLLLQRLPPRQTFAGCAAGRILLAAGAALLAVLAAFSAAESRLAFPETARALWSGLPVLALAGLAASRGTKVLLRCGSILAPILAVLYAILLLSAATQADPAWMRPENTPGQILPAFCLLLCPALSLCFRDECAQPVRGLLPTAAMVALAALSAALCAGVLSAPGAAMPASFLALAQSVSVLGVMHRFEALCSAGSLTGCFLLCALSLGGCLNCLRALLPSLDRRSGILRLSLPIAGLSLACSGLQTAWIAGAGAIYCVGLTLAALGIGFRKKSAKMQKKC